MILETVRVGPLEVNCYIIAAAEGSPAVIVDPGDDEEAIMAVLERRGLTPGLVVNTHGHYDHIGCDDSFGTPVCIHSLDAPMLREPRLNLSVLLGDLCRVRAKTRELEDGERVTCGGVTMRLIHTPGHTRGSSSFLLEEPRAHILFSGDTLFCRGVGRTDLGGGDDAALKSSLEKLLALPDGTAVYPGHGPATTIGAEKKENPYLR